MKKEFISKYKDIKSKDKKINNFKNNWNAKKLNLVIKIYLEYRAKK